MDATCAARTRKGSACAHQAGWGTQHAGVGRCKLHGGSEPHAQVNGLVLLARREQAAMGMALAIDPTDAILECIRIAAGEVAYASDRIASLQDDEVLGPVLTRSLRRVQSDLVDVDVDEDSERKPDSLVEDVRFGAPALHVWITVRRQAMDRLVAYSFAALKANIEERLVKVAEQQGALLAQAIAGILRELGVSDRPEVAAVVRKHLTLVAGGA